MGRARRPLRRRGRRLRSATRRRQQPPPSLQAVGRAVSQPRSVGATRTVSRARGNLRRRDRHYAEAIELADALSPFERARTQLLYGEWLRRHRRRIDARRHLRAALATFEQHSAAPWADRARGQLRASGESARKRDPSTRDQLTHQELNIAGFAADGLTNAEIGAQLFFSPRTIDYHLRRCSPSSRSSREPISPASSWANPLATDRAVDAQQQPFASTTPAAQHSTPRDTSGTTSTRSSDPESSASE